MFLSDGSLRVHGPQLMNYISNIFFFGKITILIYFWVAN